MNSDTIKKCKNCRFAVPLPPQYKEAYKSDIFCTETLLYTENHDYCEYHKKPVFGCMDLEK